MNKTILKYFTSIIFIFLSFSCSKQEEIPDYIKEHKVKKHTKKIFLTWKSFERKLEEYDQCGKQFCKAEDTLNLMLRKNKNHNNLELFLKALDKKSNRIKAFILRKLFFYKSVPKVLSLLKREIQNNNDETIILLASQLILTDGSQESIRFIEKHWDNFSDTIKLKLLWLIGNKYKNFSNSFINRLKQSKLPQIRALTLQFSTTDEEVINNLKKCVELNNDESHYCALFLSENANEENVKVILNLIESFNEQSQKSKYRLDFPLELFISLRKMHKNKIISEEKVFKFASKTLKNRKLSDKIRAEAAKTLGYLKNKKSRIFLDKYRHDSRKKVGHAVRRSIYLMESN